MVDRAEFGLSPPLEPAADLIPGQQQRAANGHQPRHCAGEHMRAAEQQQDRTDAAA
jgi:hypothetical protein